MNQHFVYIYRDHKAKAQYIGYGGKDSRATSHQSSTHNPSLDELIKTGKFTIEIAGPFGSEDTGRAVEAALISAMFPPCNAKKERAEWSFRPIGVPDIYSSRLQELSLQRVDFINRQGVNSSPVLFVRLSSADFQDREGYSISAPPSDEKIVDRADKYWQIGRFVDEWSERPNDSPGLLVAIHGAPGAQIVVASLLIDQNAWKDTVIAKGGLVTVPLLDPTDLDAYNLRGFRVDKSAGLKFGAIRSQFFNILKRNCHFS